MKSSDGVFNSYHDAFNAFAVCVACIVASLVIAGMAVWCLVQIVKAVV